MGGSRDSLPLIEGCLPRFTEGLLVIGFVLVFLDLAALYSQVPTELSAPNAAMAVMATKDHGITTKRGSG